MRPTITQGIELAVRLAQRDSSFDGAPHGVAFGLTGPTGATSALSTGLRYTNYRTRYTPKATRR